MRKIVFLIIISFVNTVKSQCFLKGNESNSLTYEIYNSSGDSYIDKEYYSIINHLKSYKYKVKAGFYDDKGAPNAFATTTSDPNFDGETYFGLNLLRRYLGKEDKYKFLNINLIVFHEYAHIIQFNNGMDRNRHTKWNELQADFIAGLLFRYKIITKKIALSNNAMITDTEINLYKKLATDLFYSLGDTQFGSSSHHGTPLERSYAFYAGLSSTEGINTRYDNTTGIVIDIKPEIYFELSNLYVKNLMKYSNKLVISKENLNLSQNEWDSKRSKTQILNLNNSINKSNHRFNTAILLIQRAGLYFKIKEYNKAINDYQKSYDIHKEFNQDSELFTSLINSQIQLCNLNLSTNSTLSQEIKFSLNKNLINFKILEDKSLLYVNNGVSTFLSKFKLIDGSNRNVPDIYVAFFSMPNSQGVLENYQITITSMNIITIINTSTYENTKLDTKLQFDWF